MEDSGRPARLAQQMWDNANEEDSMSDERDRFPTENDEPGSEETDVEAHRFPTDRNDVAKSDEKTGDEPDVEAHRWSSGTTRHDVP